MIPEQAVIAHTIKWITDVVVGCNFCPFAARELKRGSIFYKVIPHGDTGSFLQELMKAVHQMDGDPAVETMLLIFPHSVPVFNSYLQLVSLSEGLLHKEHYDGIYQLASFHPLYLFSGSSNNDAANYTNRSPYPMLHLLREESLTRAISRHPGTEKIPQDNIEYATQRGLLQMQLLRAACMGDVS